MQQKLFGYPNVNVSAMTPDEKMQYWEMEFTYRVQVHEASVRQKLVELALGLPANSVVVDSGAHVGDTGISLAQRLHEAGRTDVHVLMVEPDASKVAWITKKLGQLGNVKASVINSGLFSTTTRANVLRSAAHPGGWKIIPHVADGEVQLRSISDILALERPRDFFGLWHLDVEGTELHALKGLGVHRPRHILMEVVHDGSKEKHPAQEYLNTLGYKLLQRLAENDGLFELSKPGSM
jgi:FkbM family methyltransferase